MSRITRTVAAIFFAANIAQLAYTQTLQLQNIAGIVNAGSQLPQGFPNAGIAQGALFDIYGAGLSVAPPSGQPYTLAALPLPTTLGLADAVVTVTVGSTTVFAPILFASPTQIGAVMPSNTPTGSGILNVMRGNVTASVSVSVVQSAFGTSFVYLSNTSNGVGMGEQAAVTFGSNPAVPITPTNAAAPGDLAIVWGTGLGATTLAGDSQGAPYGNVGAAPVVFVGGVQSPSVTYWGRSPGSVALDQIVFTIPQTAPLGCNVSVVVETSSGGAPVVSNAPTISLASKDGATCSDPFQFVPYSAIGQAITTLYLEAQQFLTTSVTVSNGQYTTSSTTQSSARALFLSIPASGSTALTASEVQNLGYLPSPGNCYVGFALPEAGGSNNYPGTALNVGSVVTLTPPSGSPISLTQGTNGFYSSATGTATLPSGSWAISNGAGGVGASPFNVTFTMPQQVTWSNQTAVYSSPIIRSNPLTITWTGGDSNGYVDIQGISAINISADNPGYDYYGEFECSAPASAGQFVVPASILLGMNPGAGSIQVSTYTIPSTMPAVSGFTVAGNGSEFATRISGVQFR